MNPIKVAIGQYRIIGKGSLVASFTLIIYPEGQKIMDCRYFIHGDSRWFNFPQKEIKHLDGKKTDYIPLVSYLNKEYLEKLKHAVLEALKDAKPEENYDKAKNQSHQGKKDSLSFDSSSSIKEMPF